MKKFYYLVYRYFGMKLPALGKLSFGSQQFRNFLVKNFIARSGKHISINKNVVLGFNVEIGDNTGIMTDCLLQGEVIIGKDVLIGPGTHIYTSMHNFEDENILIRLQGNSKSRKVMIGNDVWIGSRVTILPGVEIGSGSVIGACSVVTKNIEPYTVVAGNPTKKIKDRKK